MDEKKLTDEEIVKALENCLNGDYKTKCKGYHYDKSENLCQDMDRYVLDLIHRLQSESQKQYEDNCLLEAENSVLRQAKDNLEIEVSDYQEKVHDLDCENAEQKAEIERLTEIMNSFRQEVITLNNEKLELQKQVDELLQEKGYLIERRNAGKKKAVKDTAKEILQGLEERKERVKAFYGIAESVGVDVAIKAVKEIVKQKGVEVEW